MKKYIILNFLILSTLTSCVKYEAEPFDGNVLPRRSGYVNNITNDWIYYNLRTGQRFNAAAANQDIKEGEQQERLDWDIAFCGFALRTNGGTSGRGDCAVADLGFGQYDKWKSVEQLPKDLAWVVDSKDVYITMSNNDWNKKWTSQGKTPPPWFDPNNGPPRVKTSANTLLANAIRFSGPPPSYIPSFHTYIVRSADGKHFYKFQIVSWFDSKMEIGETGGKISFYCDELK